MILSKELLVRQRAFNDCGAACVVSVLRYFGIQGYGDSDLPFLTPEARGVSLLSMAEAIAYFGLQARAYRFARDERRRLPEIFMDNGPIVLHIRLGLRLGHYVVLYAVHDRRIWLMDPAYEDFSEWSIGKLLRCWTGVALLVRPTQEARSFDFCDERAYGH